MRTRYRECRITKQYFQRKYRERFSQLSFGHAYKSLVRRDKDTHDGQIHRKNILKDVYLDH